MSGQPPRLPALGPRLLVVLATLLAVLAGLILAGWGLGVLLIPVTGGVDVAAVDGLRSREGGELVAVMRVVTWLGSGAALTVLGVPIGLALLWRRRRLEVLLLSLSTLGAAVLVHVVKVLVSRPRPVDPLVHTGTASFPSGHAGDAVAFYGTLALLVVATNRRRRVRAGAVVAAGVIVLAVGFSRIALGVHYPSDVLASFLLCGLWVAAAINLCGRRRSSDVMT
jgi:undecaprenyl-diphosphatase